MHLFLDSAQLVEIHHALDMWDIDGITTNPRHAAASGLPWPSLLDELARVVSGTQKPVSVEVNPHLTSWPDIVREAEALARLSPNFVVKVGASEAGFRAVRELAARGIRTNLTLVFSAAQAWHAARAGATYVSPFLGWKDAHGDESRVLVQEVASILRAQGSPTQIIAAAVRNSRQLVQAACDGAHCATASFSVIQESFQHPYTAHGERVFGAAWDELQQR